MFEENENSEYLENLRNLAFLNLLTNIHHSLLLSNLIKIISKVIGSDYVKVWTLPKGLSEITLPSEYKYDTAGNLTEIIYTDEEQGWKKHIYIKYDATGDIKSIKEEVEITT